MLPTLPPQQQPHRRKRERMNWGNKRITQKKGGGLKIESNTWHRFEVRGRRDSRRFVSG